MDVILDPRTDEIILREIERENAPNWNDQSWWLLREGGAQFDDAGSFRKFKLNLL